MLVSITILLGSVDINTATKGELVSLNGIGNKKADSILKYRETKCFSSVDSLVKVKGIGKKLLEKNRDDLTASGCPTH